MTPVAQFAIAVQFMQARLLVGVQAVVSYWLAAQVAHAEQTRFTVGVQAVVSWVSAPQVAQAVHAVSVVAVHAAVAYLSFEQTVHRLQVRPFPV